MKSAITLLAISPFFLANADVPAAGTSQNGGGNSGHGPERKRQQNMHPRTCYWESGSFWCDALKNCREDAKEQMTICDLVYEKWPKSDP